MLAIVKAVERLTPCVAVVHLAAKVRRPEPGQFFMVYVPGFEEVPIAAADWSPGELTVVVEAVGPTTRAMVSASEGARWLIRGPIGRGFSTSHAKRVLAVGGGTGVAPLYLLAKRRFEAGLETDAVVGFRTAERTIVIPELRSYVGELVVCTDDGTLGEKGTALEHASRLLKRGGYDLVCGCGSEGLLRALFDLCEKLGVDAQLALTRLVRCGSGVCGSCAIEGKSRAYRVCVEGPVFPSSVLRELVDFGRYCFDETGAKVPVAR